MKILHIIYSLESGGLERFVVDLLNEFALTENEVTLCTLRDDSILNNGFYKEEILDSVNYINLKLKPGFKLSNIFVLFKKIKNLQPDIVHCHGNLVNYIFPISIVLKKKYFYTIHNAARTEVGSKLEFWIRNYFFKRSINSITISKETSNSFSDFYNHQNFTEIVNGRKTLIKSNDFSSVKLYFDELRRTTSHIFLHIGRCNPQKNQKMLISVFNRLIDEGKQIKLLILGDGFSSKLGVELKSISNENIIYLGIKHNVSDYLYNADAFCLSSIHEGMPISLIEALSCGCTPICTPVGGIVNTIFDGVNGYISKSISEADYYESINKYLNQKEKLSKIKLIDYYKDNFSIENCAEQHIKAYSKVLK